MTSQDQFEAWAAEHLPTLYLTKTEQGTYESTATGNFFAAWSARDGEIERLKALLDTPHTNDWFEGVRLEAGHQIQRWGADNDAGKAPADWFWLIGYLAQKAMTAQMSGDEEKARHHTISTGAAMLNWFRSIVGDSDAMRPGISQEEAQP